jgi:DNA-binding FadR family transcriptional regulator
MIGITAPLGAREREGTGVFRTMTTVTRPVARTREQLGSSVRLPKLGQVIAERIRRQIVRGELVEGDVLPSEPDLLEQFQISRPTLREAFRILESEGLLSVHRGAGGGARVHAPDAGVLARYATLILQTEGTTLNDVRFARQVIEPPAVRHLTEHADETVLDKLDALLADEQAALADPTQHALAAARFHEAVVVLAGNATLALFQTMLAGIIDAHTVQVSVDHDGTHLDPGTRADIRRETLRAHKHLMRIIRKGDAEEAERFWWFHMSAASVRYDTEGQTTLLELFESDNFRAEGS